MTGFNTVSRAAVSLWARWYTAGLPAGVRDDRRRELESDLSEHSAARTDEGWSPLRIASERAGRTIRGAAADLAWRRAIVVANLSGAPAPAPETRQTFLRREWPTPAGLALAAAYMLLGVYLLGLAAVQDLPLLRLFEADDVAGRTAGGLLVFTLGACVAVAALVRLLHSLVADITLLLAGTLALPFYWMVFPTLLGVLAILGAVNDFSLRPTALGSPSQERPPVR